MTAFHLRPYADHDFDAAMQVWLEAWKATLPEIDFDERLEWWKQYWLNHLLPTDDIIVALDHESRIIGFVTFTPATCYLDQIVVVPSWHGKGVAEALLDYVKGRSGGLVTARVNENNPRSLHFFQKEGFVVTGKDINEHSGLPVYLIRWAKPPT